MYKLRGGSFAVLSAGPEEATDAVRDDASGALFEVGDGFVIWSSGAEVILPDQAGTVDTALELVDRRARSQHEDPGADAELRPPEDPIEALGVSEPLYDVGELARRVGRCLGVGDGTLIEIEAAALLRDIGNVAVPSAVLDPRRRPSRPRMAVHPPSHRRRRPAARGAVRRWTRSPHSCARATSAGTASATPTGYSGEEIPLGSRIVFACGAFVDMTTGRPHRPALDAEGALGELDDGAGSQFDPRVVRAFHDVLEEDGDLVLSERRLRSRRPLRVLLAEADPVERFLSQRGIEAAGHDCSAVADGRARSSATGSLRPT